MGNVWWIWGINKLLVWQPGELPVPKKSKEYQKFGNYTFMDFVSDNWFSLTAIAFIILLLLFYFWQKKKDEDKSKLN